jgi:hypothetical protein
MELNMKPGITSDGAMPGFIVAFRGFLSSSASIIPYEVGNSQISCDYDFLMIIWYE